MSKWFVCRIFFVWFVFYFQISFGRLFLSTNFFTIQNFDNYENVKICVIDYNFNEMFEIFHVMFLLFARFKNDEQFLFFNDIIAF